jgi:GINS complex subunit 4
MADFSNLLGEIDELENTQPPIQDPENELESSGQILDTPSNPTDEIPSVLRKARDELELQRERLTASTFDATQDTAPFEALDASEETQTDDDFQLMKKVWIQELNSPELLPFEPDLYPMLLELLGHQQDTLDQLQSQAQSEVVDPALASLAASICKMDMDRMSFLLADYTRTRLEKIEMHALHNRDLIDRMNDTEVAYLKGYGELFEAHMRRSVTNHIPKEAWQSLDVDEMIERPDLDSFVFAENVSEETVEIDQYIGLNIEEDEEEGDRYVSCHPGKKIFVRYRCIRGLISEHKVQLLM